MPCVLLSNSHCDRHPGHSERLLLSDPLISPILVPISVQPIVQTPILQSNRFVTSYLLDKSAGLRRDPKRRAARQREKNQTAQDSFASVMKFSAKFVVIRWRVPMFSIYRGLLFPRIRVLSRVYRIALYKAGGCNLEMGSRSAGAGQRPNYLQGFVFTDDVS